MSSTSDKIREDVHHRHWQLFEMRLKDSSTETKQDNYTQRNNYRILNRLKPNEPAQSPIEPNQRWQRFCSQLTTNSNETDRLMSLFRHVWVKNWNTVSNTSDKALTSNENNCWKCLSPNDREKKILSSILHRTF